MKTETRPGNFLSSLLRRTGALLLAAIAGFMVLPASTFGQGTIPAGSGTSGSPYIITTSENLVYVSTHSTLWGAGVYFRMNASINLQTIPNFTPIGNPSVPFNGTFNGAGYTISSLNIIKLAEDYSGLFGNTGSSAVIDSLGLVNPVVSGAGKSGGLVGLNSGAVRWCYVENGTITGTSHCVGGLIGWNNGGTVTGCYAAGTVTVNRTAYPGALAIGGLIGWHDGRGLVNVSNCYSRMKVIGPQRVGGLIGFIFTGAGAGNVDKCYATGAVDGTSESGGMAGRIEAGPSVLSNCYWATDSSGKSTSVGGTGRTAAEMRLPSTFTAWDFTNVWVMQTNANSGFPFFTWLARPAISTLKIEGAIDSSRRMSEMTCYGDLISLSMAPPTAYGFCWNTTGLPTTAHTVIPLAATAAPGSFSARITGLSAADTTIYYVRAYATNNSGTFYGEVKTFIRGVLSYHWQPSLSAQPANGAGFGGDVPALGPNNPGNFKVVSGDSSALWLDPAADGKRYCYNLQAAGLTWCGYDFNDNLPSLNHTFYITTKNTVPMLAAVIQRTATTYNRANFKYSNDTMYVSLFERNHYTFLKKVSLKKAKSSGNWLPWFIHMKNVSPNSVRYSLGCADEELASVTVADTAGGFWPQRSVYGWITSDSAAGLLADVHVFSSYDSTGAAGIWKQYFSPGFVINDSIQQIPTLIQNILYDPPGNASYSTCTFDSSTVTDVNFNWSTNAAASLEVGVKGSISFGIAAGGLLSTSLDWQATARAEAHYAYNHNQGFQVSLSSSKTQSSMVDSKSDLFIGPTFGDLVVYQSIAYKTVAMKRPRMSKFLTAAAPADFVYAASGGIPMPDLCGTVNYKPIRTLLQELQGDSVGLAFLQNEYPYDLKTGKLLASSRVPGLNQHGETVPARVENRGTAQVITGNIPYRTSVTREDITTADATNSWGASAAFTVGVWCIAGLEYSMGGGYDFALTNGSSTGSGSTVEINFQDEDSWDVFRIQPAIDHRFKTLMYIVDSAQSFTSFPYEPVNSRPAVTWTVSAISPVTGFTGQETNVTVSVTNTSSKANCPNLPPSFPFSVSAINFPGTFSVYPENASIAIGQTVTFTCTFTGMTDTTLTRQQLMVSCSRPSDLYTTMDDLQEFSLTLTTPTYGLYSSVSPDTFTLVRPAAMSHVFPLKMINVGTSSGIIEFGTTSVTGGATTGYLASSANPVNASATYGTFVNQVGSGDSVTLNITLTGIGADSIFTAKIWTRIKDQPATQTEHIIVIRVVNQSSIAGSIPANNIRHLAITPLGKGMVALQVPPGEQPTLRLYSASGEVLLSKLLAGGSSTLDVSSLQLVNGLYILRLEGKRIVQQKILVSGKH